MATPLLQRTPQIPSLAQTRILYDLFPTLLRTNAQYLTSAQSSGKPLSYEKVKDITCHSFLSLDISPLTERYMRSVEMPQGTCVKSRSYWKTVTLLPWVRAPARDKCIIHSCFKKLPAIPLRVDCEPCQVPGRYTRDDKRGKGDGRRVREGSLQAFPSACEQDASQAYLPGEQG